MANTLTPTKRKGGKVSHTNRKVQDLSVYLLTRRSDLQYASWCIFSKLPNIPIKVIKCHVYDLPEHLTFALVDSSTVTNENVPILDGKINPFIGVATIRVHHMCDFAELKYFVICDKQRLGYGSLLMQFLKKWLIFNFMINIETGLYDFDAPVLDKTRNTKNNSQVSCVPVESGPLIISSNHTAFETLVGENDWKRFISSEANDKKSNINDDAISISSLEDLPNTNGSKNQSFSHHPIFQFVTFASNDAMDFFHRKCGFAEEHDLSKSTIGPRVETYERATLMVSNFESLAKGTPIYIEFITNKIKKFKVGDSIHLLIGRKCRRLRPFDAKIISISSTKIQVKVRNWSAEYSEWVWPHSRRIVKN